MSTTAVAATQEQPRRQVKVTRSMVASARAQVSIARELGKSVAPAIAKIAQVQL